MYQKKVPRIIVFDVNETLLDITSLEPFFDRVFCERSILREWFAQLILYSQTMTLSGLYIPFGELAVGTLRMVAAIHGAIITDVDINELTTRMSKMPAHHDVVPALKRLQDAEFRMVTLTNSVNSSSLVALKNAGLSGFFEHSFSVETVRKFKPAPEAYHLVAKKMHVDTSDMCLVACHFWDTMGAQAAGCKGALIARPHNAFLPAIGVPMPDITASNLMEFADQIMRL